MVQSQDYDMNLAMFMGQMGATVNPTIYKSTLMHQDQVNTLTLNEHQVMALIGASMALDNTIASVVEYKVPDFMQMPGGPEAVYKELQEMTKRRFNTEKPIPQHLKRTANNGVQDRLHPEEGWFNEGQACPEGSEGKKEAARHKNSCCCAITLSHETPDRCC